MKKILILNGPNLNLLGVRQPEIYGNTTFEDYLKALKSKNSNLEIHYFQSNVEGELINKLHEVGFSFDGVVLNGGAYTHTSIAIADAIKGITTPVIEVHISNIHAREEYRHKSYTAEGAVGQICGLGLYGYQAALNYFSQAD